LLVDQSRRFAALSESLNLEVFLTCTHIVVCTGNTGHAHERAESLLCEAIPPTNIAQEVPSFTIAMLMLSGTNHLLTAPDLAARALAHRLGLVILPCPLRLPPFTISQYWHKRFALDPAPRWLRNLIHDAAAEALNLEPFEMPIGAAPVRPCDFFTPRTSGLLPTSTYLSRPVKARGSNIRRSRSIRDRFRLCLCISK
jgi:hypothetical protein